MCSTRPLGPLRAINGPDDPEVQLPLFPRKRLTPKSDIAPCPKSAIERTFTMAVEPQTCL